MKNPLGVLATAGRRLSRSVALRVSPATRICGMVVVNATDADQTNQLFKNVEEAIHLIGNTDERLFGRIRGILDRIVIVDYPGSSYWPELRACVLSRLTIERQSREWVASVIVHEACHGRLALRGFRYEQPWRARLERACVRAQQRFLGKIPGTERLRAHLDQQVVKGFSDVDEGAHRKAAQLQSLGVPKWLARRL